MHNIIVITPEGKILKDYNSDWTNKDLTRYANEIKTSPLRFEQLYKKIDPIGPIEVYMIDERTIIRHTADQYGWPHVTDSWVQQYENTVYPSYQEARAVLMRILKKYGMFYYQKHSMYNHASQIWKSFTYIILDVWYSLSSWVLLVYHMIKRR